MPLKRPVRTVDLTVGAKFVLPKFYEDAEPAQIEQALTLGALVSETVVNAKASAELQEILVKKQTEVDALRQRFQEQVTELQRHTEEQIGAANQQKEEEVAFVKSQSSKKIAELQAEMERISEERPTLIAKHAKELRDATDYMKTEEGKIRQAERDMVTQQMNQRIERLQTDINISAERIAGLNERKSQLEMSRTEDMREAQERAIALIQRAMDEKDRSIASAQETIRKLNENYGNLNESFRQLMENITRRQANAKLKGNDFEGELRALLFNFFGTYEGFSLVDSSKFGIGHSGDIVMQWGDDKILWEGKNYDEAVPTAEVDKFLRDMRENKTIRVGIMISKRSAITGKTDRGDLKTEFVDGQMTIYISRFDTFTHSTLLPILLELCHVHWKAGVEPSKDDSKESAIRHIESLYNTMKDYKTNWRRQKSHMEEGLQFMAEMVETFEETIARTIKNLRAGSTTTQTEVPTNIFRQSMGDEKMETTIQIMLEITEVQEDGSVSLNEVADILAKRKALARDTAKQHIKAVLLDSVLFQEKSGKPICMRGLVMRKHTVENTIV